MKKTQVIKCISNEIAAFAQMEARRDMSYAEYCTSIKTKPRNLPTFRCFATRGSKYLRRIVSERKCVRVRRDL